MHMPSGVVSQTAWGDVGLDETEACLQPNTLDHTELLAEGRHLHVARRALDARYRFDQLDETWRCESPCQMSNLKGPRASAMDRKDC